MLVVKYWDVQNVSSQEKLNGLAFSILSMLDGESGELPGYEVRAIGTSEDMEYAKENNKNYYPIVAEDIAGDLHENFYKK